MIQKNISNTIPTVSSINLPLCAYAISKFNSIFVSSKSEDGRVRFTLVLKEGTTLDKIEQDFNNGGQVGGRAYSTELKKLKGIVIETLRSQGRVL